MRLRPLRHEDRVGVWAVASALLRYPTEEQQAALPQIAAAASELRVPAGGQIAALCETWAQEPLSERQARYVEAFDLGRSRSLYLTWHQYGDRRQRGMVLLKLKRRMAEHGFAPVTEELPDWLPLVLEFATRAPDPAGRELLEDWRAPLELIRRNLRDRGDAEAAIFDALSGTLSRAGSDTEALIARLMHDGPPDEEVGLSPFGPDAENWDQLPPSGYEEPRPIAMGGRSA